MRTKLLLTMLLAVILLPAAAEKAVAQDYLKDTVWTKKTDQLDGFYQVKFSNNDSIIVGNGVEKTLFFDTETGEEIIRIPGNNEVFFLDNDTKFLRVDEPRTKYEIFDTETYQVIDSLENDGIKSTGSIDVSGDEKYLITNIQNGFRIFDLESKKILKTKVFPDEPNLIYSVIDYVFFVCDDRNFIAHRVRTYEDPKHPGDKRYYKTYGDYNLHDFTTLDSIDTFINSRGMKRSNNCMYYAIATGDKYNGVEIYDFNTKQLLHRLPINGPSLTGFEFSPDDKYIVTSNGPGANSLIVWDVMTGNQTHRYWPYSHMKMDVSHNGLFIISIVGNYLRLFHARFGNTSIPKEDGKSPLLYPNPTTGEVNINTDMKLIDEVLIYDIQGNKYIDNLLRGNDSIVLDGAIRFNVGNLPNGEYIVLLKGKKVSQSYKLIINR